MSAQDHLGTQFMSMRQMGTLTAGDMPDHSMEGLAQDDYARWEKDRDSPYEGNGKFDDLTNSVAEHGVQQPIEVGIQDGEPSVVNGHHRYLAAYDSGEVSKVPVTGRTSVVNHIARYSPPGNVSEGMKPEGYDDRH